MAPFIEATLNLRLAIARLLVQIARELAPREVDGERDYLRWRLDEILPLLEEARDALPAITEASRRLHGIRADLALRMDMAGTRTRAAVEIMRARNPDTSPPNWER